MPTSFTIKVDVSEAAFFRAYFPYNVTSYKNIVALLYMVTQKMSFTDGCHPKQTGFSSEMFGETGRDHQVVDGSQRNAWQQ